jgi:hypothetical protein
MTHNDCVWFRENSAAQAALGRVRELLNAWEARADAYEIGDDRVTELRAALDGEGA